MSVIASLAIPSDPGVLIPAAQWLEAALLGSVATALATLAIACCGLLMLTGRLELRRGMIVVLGCFILFGARTMASGFLGAVNQTAAVDVMDRELSETPLAHAQSNLPTRPQSTFGDDPNAGVAVQ